MIQGLYIIENNIEIAEGIFEMVLTGDSRPFKRPGQFVNIKLEGKFLRRPISVCCYDEAKLTLVYKVVGAGTRQMSQMQRGEQLDLLAGLGNGFDTSKSGDTPLLIGGGVGAAPLYGLCRELARQGKRVSVALGFNTKSEMYYVDELAGLDAKVYVATADGSFGTKGFVTSLLQEIEHSFFYACGPMPMLEAVNAAISTQGEISLEERMGCGFGACMGCTCKTLTGGKRVCKDGPVFERKEIIWPTHE